MIEVCYDHISPAEPKHFTGMCHAAVKRLVREDKFPHVLFYGPPGTGKTSTILAVAKQMYGTSLRSMVLELNASDDRGINIVREQIVDFASTKTMFRYSSLAATASARDSL
jgi:replication factor C subunit 3/5